MHWLLGLTYICPVPYDKWDDDPKWLTSFKEVAQHGSTTKWYMCIHDHRSSILKHYWSCIYLLYIMCFMHYEHLWTFMNIYEHLWTFMNIYEPRYHVVFHVVFHVFWQDNSPLCGVSPQESAGSLDMLVAIALVRTTQWPISLRPKCLVKNDGSMKVSLW
jgi:hypothetical protein